VRDRVVQFCKNFPATDSAALYRHVDKYVDEILEIIAKKEAAKCSVPTSSTSLGGDSESEAEIVGDSTFDDDSESEYTEEDF
uniref:Uncharacterized protein n=1 Tax=Caenorhabditis japonica TaxID=281687 RepID=A0A8R1IKD3_CAEJA